MALSNELPVYVETYHYIQAVLDTHKNFPRDIKHTVGQEWIKRVISLPTFIVRANMFKSEREAIGKQVTAWKNASKKRYRKREIAEDGD